MNSAARSELIVQLNHLLEHGDSMSMLVITVRNTSNSILAGLRNGEISLDYPKAGWFDIARSRKFKAFCRACGYNTQNVSWGKERIIRANIGADSSQAAESIDACFGAVYGETGPFGLEFRGLGWQPFILSLAGDTAKPRTSS